MRCSVRCKGVILLSVLLVHTALGSPIVKRDVRLLLGDDKSSALADPKVSLVNADVFGGEVHENGARDKRTLKVGALVLGGAAKAVGAGVHAVHAGVKSVAVAGAKTVGKAALKVATTVGVKVAKAAITIGIAKLLLHLVFGKINQLIDFKTRLLGNVGNGKGLLASSNLGSLSSSSGSSSSSSGGSSSGGATGAADAGYDGGSETTEGTAGDSEIGDELVIDPQKVSLQIPSEIVGGGFEVVNKGAPVIGNLIQNTAERLVNIGASLKPLLGFSLGFGGARNGNYKRETDEFGSNESKPEQENGESSDVLVTAEAPSQFKRMVDPSQRPTDVSSEESGTSESSVEQTSEEEQLEEEEEKKQLENTLLAKKVIEKLIQRQIRKDLATEYEEKSPEPTTSPQIIHTKRETMPSKVFQQPSMIQAPVNQQIAMNQATGNNPAMHQPPENPYAYQQFRDYNPHVKRQAPMNDYYQYQYQQYPQWYPQYRNQYYPPASYSYGY